MAEAEKQETSPSGLGEIARLLECDVPDADWPRLADGLAELHQEVRKKSRELEVLKAEHKERVGTINDEIAATLSRMDPLADKVKQRKFKRYVQCEVLNIDKEGGVQTLRRLDTGEEFEEPLATGDDQQSMIEEDGTPPPEKGAGKLCRCPWHPGQAMPGETWNCPEYGHMWRRPENTKEGDPIIETYEGK